MNDNVSIIIGKILEGLEVSQDQKNLLVGLYTMAFYKACVETILTIKGRDSDFFRGLNRLVDDAITSMNTNEKTQFEEVLEIQKSDILTRVLGTFSSNLPLELKNKIRDNVARLAGSSVEK